MIHYVGPRKLKEILTQEPSFNVDNSEGFSNKLSEEEEELKAYLDDELGDIATSDEILAVIKECPDAASADPGVATYIKVLALLLITSCSNSSLSVNYYVLSSPCLARIIIHKQIVISHFFQVPLN